MPTRGVNLGLRLGHLLLLRRRLLLLVTVLIAVCQHQGREIVVYVRVLVYLESAGKGVRAAMSR